MKSNQKIVVRKRLLSQKGFTLAEVVLTVAVLAILISISTPSVYEFVRQREKQNEEIAQTEIRKAMRAYLAAKSVLPSDTATGAEAWYNKLAGYTNLSADEIQNDVWGRPRTYLAAQIGNRDMFGVKVGVYYATIHSMGENVTAENQDAQGTVAGIAINVNSGQSKNTYQASTNSNWWKSPTKTDDLKVSEFSQLRGAGDDIMMRFTNYNEVLDSYNTTLMRLDKISQALETYSRSEYAARASFCSSSDATAAKCDSSNIIDSDGNAKTVFYAPEKTIYYPKSLAVERSGSNADNSLYSDSAVMVDNQKNDTKRREGMENLMLKLGLPIEYCCSALIAASDEKPMPFYYFSNPRPRDADRRGCGPRPKADETKLPARVTSVNISDNVDDSTCG